MENLLRDLSKYYTDVGINTCPITNVINDFNVNSIDILKSPCKEWKHLRFKSPIKDYFTDTDWEFATGIGAVLGYKDLRAIDVDVVVSESVQEELIKSFLKILKLPKDYEWVVRSGSGKGFHIYFKSNPVNLYEIFIESKTHEIDLVDRPDYDLNKIAFKSALESTYGHGFHDPYNSYWDGVAASESVGRPIDPPPSNFAGIRRITKIIQELTSGNIGETFYSNQFDGIPPAFKVLELRYEGFMVLPPSLHRSEKKYDFLNLAYPKIVPINFPLFVETDDVKSLIYHACVFDKAVCGSDGPIDYH